MNKGYIKLDRSITNNWLWQQKPFSEGQAWIDLLLMANHKDHKRYYKGTVNDYKRGQVNTSLMYLADRWGWSRKKVTKFIETLKSDGMVTTKGTTKGTTITIEKYSVFQGEGTTKGTTKGTTMGQPRDNEGTTKGQPGDIHKNYKNAKNAKECSVFNSIRTSVPGGLTAEGVALWEGIKAKRGITK